MTDSRRITIHRPIRSETPLRGLEGRRTKLSPPSREFAEYMLRSALEGEIPWIWHGPENPRLFEEAFWHDVLLQYAVLDKRSGAPVGYLRADRANSFHGFAYVTMVLFPAYQMRGWPLEAAFLFGHQIFKRYVFMQRLYAEVTGSALQQYRSGEGHLFEIEGCLRNRCVVDGVREDLYILTFERGRFMAADDHARADVPAPNVGSRSQET